MEFHNKLDRSISITRHDRVIFINDRRIDESVYLRFSCSYYGRSKRQAEALRRAHWNIYDSLVAKDFVAGSFAMQRHFDIVGEKLEYLQKQLDN
ncbi:MAG: hypothetical protein ACLTS6_17160 [Anaerobutyricum sp.]